MHRRPGLCRGAELSRPDPAHRGGNCLGREPILSTGFFRLGSSTHLQFSKDRRIILILSFQKQNKQKPTKPFLTILRPSLAPWLRSACTGCIRVSSRSLLVTLPPAARTAPPLLPRKGFPCCHQLLCRCCPQGHPPGLTSSLLHLPVTHPHVKFTASLASPAAASSVALLPPCPFCLCLPHGLRAL